MTMTLVKPLIVLLVLALPAAGCGRKGPLKPPADARAVPPTLTQEDQSSPSNTPVESEPVITE